jgi:hypothetical protein
MRGESSLSFKKDNADYEDWLRARCKRIGCKIVKRDLILKYDKMKENAFVFLRATFFRWAKRIEAVCPELAEAPQVLSVGDTHVENFGTWRDDEGRLVWGVNDFDEAAVIPYPFDLVRLATSIRLAAKRNISNHDAAAAIAKGYVRGLAAPQPTLLKRQEKWMHPYIKASDRERPAFWKKLNDLRTGDVPAPATAALHKSVPENAAISKIAPVYAKGMGSLGRPRFVALATWRGGEVAREAKALIPSAWEWAHGNNSAPSCLHKLATSEFRAPDPWLKIHNDFVCRRVAPDARKANMKDDGDRLDLNFDLFGAMGFDLGAIHAADGQVTAIVRHLRKQSKDWLYAAAEAAAADVEKDFEGWRR